MSNLRFLVPLAIAGCGSSAPPATQPSTPPSPAPVADAAVEATPDALPDALLDAPASIFRYSTADRKETWTLRRDGGTALLIVETAQGERRYVGTARESDTSIVLDVATSNAKMALDCKREKLAVSAKCNDKKAKPIDVLNCYHADFKTPMPFGPAPGIEYVVDASCNGYRKVAP